MSATLHTTQQPSLEPAAISFAIDASGIDDRARAALLLDALRVPGIRVDVRACEDPADDSVWTLDACVGPWAQPEDFPFARLHVEWLGAFTASLPTPGAITDIPMLEIVAPDGTVLAQHKLGSEVAARIAWGLQLRVAIFEIYRDGVVPMPSPELDRALGTVWDAPPETLDELRHALAKQRDTRRRKLELRLRRADLRFELADVMGSLWTHMSVIADARADRDARRVLVTDLALCHLSLIALIQQTGEIQA